MANAIFTTSESSAYNDKPEERYHFPKTYLNQAQRALGDWIVYYEPRRTSGVNSSSGRRAYFAMALVHHIAEDRTRDGHYYAYLRSYVEFDRAVPFAEQGRYFESMLRKPDGSTNKGAFGRSVRELPQEQFAAIVKAGFTRDLDAWENAREVAEPVAEYVVRPIVEQVVSRKFRDEAFRRHVRKAYDNTCAVTGLQLLNGGGRPEVQAAHIRSVESDGPDTVRNGIALTGTVHWMFDRGLMSFDDAYRVMLSPQGLPDGLDRLIRTDRPINIPRNPKWRPHPTYLAWHRDNVFKR